jgi:DNA polymerase-1
MSRVLLLDADVIAYSAASACEVATHWGDGYWTWHVEENEVKDSVRAQIEQTMDELDGDSYKLCLTDSLGNFRRSVLPTYKGNRASVKKPIVLKEIKQWMIDELDAYYRPGLEGDDCMGILATVKSKDERVIVSIDKDMKTIPGLFCRNTKGCWEITEVSEDEADYWHLYQTLTGDTTDGYTGCPGIGPKKAEAILFGGSASWETNAQMWAAVVKAFDKAGLGDEEALVQARVARILRASDYNFKTKEPILWTP